jgi:AcrR family transcriptional regulator
MASITRGSSRSAPRRTATEQRVLDAVERLLDGGESFTELGVQRIADEAGVARSSFYAHFPDKTRLLLALAQRLSVTARNAHDGWSANEADSLPRMLDGFVAIVAHYREHARILAAVLEVAGYDRDVASVWDAELAIFRDRVQNWLETEQAAGRTSDRLDAGATARIIVDGGMRTIADQVIHRSVVDDERVAREMGAVWWFGAFRRP